MIQDITKYKTAEDLQRSFREERNNDMNDLTTYSSYDEYKKTLDTELKAQAEGFVRVGYLLKIARDTNVLSKSGYKNVAEFAHTEYGLTKDVVSRYIAINDRYSENGYSDRLQARFENFGYSKLTEMLTLPEEIIAEIEPSLTRKEIQEIKREIAEEEEITPLEVMAEAAAEENVRDEESFTLRQRIWKAYFHTNKTDFWTISKKIGPDMAPVPLESDIDTLIDILAPTGVQVLWSRIPGIGKIMISIKGKDVPITFTNTRDGSKLECSAEDIYHDLGEIYGKMSKRAWEKLYGEPFDTDKEEKNPEVAPVQQPEHVEVPKVQNTENIVKAPAEPSPWKEMNQPEADITEPAKEAEAEVIECEEASEAAVAAAEEQTNQKSELEEPEPQHPEIEKVEGEIVSVKSPDEGFCDFKIVLELIKLTKHMTSILQNFTFKESPGISDYDLRILNEDAESIKVQLKNLAAGRSGTYVGKREGGADEEA